MGTYFAKWLDGQIKMRGWNHQEFCERAGISPSMTSFVMRGKRTPGETFLKGTARALGLPLEVVLREAGMLPRGPNDEATLQELIDFAQNLSEQERRELVAYARWRYSQQEPDEKSNPA